MAIYTDYTPLSTIGRALFNFTQTLGIGEFRLSGTVRVSVSDPFTIAQYQALGANDTVYTQSVSAIRPWTQEQLAAVDAITTGIAQIANIDFTPVRSFAGSNPAQVGANSDINIYFVYRPNMRAIAGASGLNSDAGNSESFRYPGAQGDILLNSFALGDTGGVGNVQLGPTHTGGYTLLHEIGHSLGLAHPHVAQLPNGTRVVSSSYAQTAYVGFRDLGFALNREADMDKDHFTIMSYDQTITSANQIAFPQNPMILDVIALQEAYGVGTGTSGAGDDTIAPGADGLVTSHRTYFDIGGTDTVDLRNYTGGAYLHLGTTIEGARQLVGLSTSRQDDIRMAAGGDPESVRWYYGSFENATGSAVADRIVGNTLANIIRGSGGDDTLSGGAGEDIAVYSGQRAQYFLRRAGEIWQIADQTSNRDGNDRIDGFEWIRFADRTIAAPETLDPIGVAIANQLAVVYLGRGISFDWRNATASVVGSGAPGAILEAFFEAGIRDGAFSTTDGAAELVEKTFLNIFGVSASAFERTAWSQAVESGAVVRPLLPWVIFNSYLGATNVPASYQVPAQSRIVAVDAFTNAVQGTIESTLGGPGSAGAEAARSWLRPIRGQSDAATKVIGADTDASMIGSQAAGRLEVMGLAGDTGTGSILFAG